MAEEYAGTPMEGADEGGKAATSSLDDAKLVARVRRRFRQMYDADQENRREAAQSLRFAVVPGAQWDENMLRDRGNNRPHYTFNRLRVNGKRIINEIRGNTPSGKVAPGEGGDVETAQIINGIGRNIWGVSKADQILDEAAEHLVFAGMCAWRVTQGYHDPESFDQDVMIKPIANPLNLYCDEAAKDPYGADARDWLLTERMHKAEFESRYPDAKKVDFENAEIDFDDQDHWEGDQVRIAEYHWKEREEALLCKLSDGRVVWKDKYQPEPGVSVVGERESWREQIWKVTCSGDAILEAQSRNVGRFHDFVRAYGEYIIVEGRRYWYGVVPFARDAQQSYNVSRTSVAESIAMAPQAKFWATADQAKGNVPTWKRAHKENIPFMVYTHDPKAPGPPQRMGGADVPVALMQECQMAADEIDAVTGIYQDDRGQVSSSQSGRAILARQSQGRVATLNYPDRMRGAAARTWQIMVDRIPLVYDTDRVVRVLGEDMETEDMVRINAGVQGKTGYALKNDLSRGKYDVTVSSGPGYKTLREEASTVYENLLQSAPDLMNVIGDLVFKSMDLPYAEEISGRLRTLLPPEIQQMLGQGENAQNDPQSVIMMAQQMSMQAEQAMASVQQAAAELQQEKASVDEARAGVEDLIHKMEVLQATVQRDVAREMLRLEQQQSETSDKQKQLGLEKLQLETAQTMDSARDSIAETVAGQAVDSMAQGINSLAEGMGAELADLRQRLEANKPRRPKYVEAVREGGKLRAVPVFEDDEDETLTPDEQETEN